MKGRQSLHGIEQYCVKYGGRAASVHLFKIVAARDMYDPRVILPPGRSTEVDAVSAALVSSAAALGGFDYDI